MQEIQQSRRILAKGRVVQMVQDEVLTSRQTRSVRDVVLHPGGVCVLPVLPDGRLMLIQQYRYPTGEVLWEFPAGKLDVEGEAPKEAIERELWEETGYQSDEWQEHGYIYTAPGFCDERIYLYVARACHEAKQLPDQVDDEDIQVSFFSGEEVFAMVKKGAIKDAKTLALLSLYQLGI